MAITKKQAQRLVDAAQALVEGQKVLRVYPDGATVDVAKDAYGLCVNATYITQTPPPEPKWRPFKDGDEFKPFRSGWIKLADPVGAEERSARFRCDKYDLDGIWTCEGFESYAEMFDKYKFDDETSSPFGVKE